MIVYVESEWFEYNNYEKSQIQQNLKLRYIYCRKKYFKLFKHLHIKKREIQKKYKKVFDSCKIKNINFNNLKTKNKQR